MRRFIDLVENTQTFFHGSRKLFKSGTILLPQKHGYVHGTGFDKKEKGPHIKTELFLDGFRPKGSPSRFESVFLVTDIDDIDGAGGYVDHVYEVIPNGPVWKANLYWYSELFSYYYDDVDYYETSRMAQGYWAAKPSDDPSRDLYEYLTTSATVIREV